MVIAASRDAGFCPVGRIRLNFVANIRFLKTSSPNPGTPVPDRQWLVSAAPPTVTYHKSASNAFSSRQHSDYVRGNITVVKVEEFEYARVENEDVLADEPRGAEVCV